MDAKEKELDGLGLRLVDKGSLLMKLAKESYDVERILEIENWKKYAQKRPAVIGYR